LDHILHCLLDVITKNCYGKHTCTPMHARIHTHTHKHARTHTHAHACTHARLHACTHTRINTPKIHAHEHTHAHTHTCTNARTHSLPLSHIHTYTYAHIHICTYTHITCTSQDAQNSEITSIFKSKTPLTFVYNCMCIYIHMCIRTQTCIHLYICTPCVYTTCITGFSLLFFKTYFDKKLLECGMFSVFLPTRHQKLVCLRTMKISDERISSFSLSEGTRDLL